MIKLNFKEASMNVIKMKLWSERNELKERKKININKSKMINIFFLVFIILEKG